MTIFEIVLLGFGSQLVLFKRTIFDQLRTTMWFSYAIGAKEINLPFIRRLSIVLDIRTTMNPIGNGYLIFSIWLCGVDFTKAFQIKKGADVQV